jgi:hypothetical protein
VAVIWLWCARVAWALLPVTAGGALADALDGWSTAPALLAALASWIAWVAGLLALVAPRPWGFTVLRVLAPGAVLVTIASAWSTSGVEAVAGGVGAAVACGLALGGPVADAAAASLAYGDERRFPLRTPSPLLAGPVPLAVLLVLAGGAAGPLLLADGRVVAGVVVTALGLPIAALLARSLHVLSKRWLVFVPAGLVVVDPLTLLDPVLMPQEGIAAVGEVAVLQAADAVLDLRLGTLGHAFAVELTQPVGFGRRQGRRGARVVDASTVLTTPLRPRAVVSVAHDRHLGMRR